MLRDEQCLIGHPCKNCILTCNFNKSHSRDNDQDEKENENERITKESQGT